MLISLTVNATAEQKARLLDAKVAENAETIQQLREERSLLATEFKDLQKRYTDISEVIILFSTHPTL